MNRTSIARQSATLLIVALSAIVAVLVRRDQLARRLLVQTINELVEGGRQ
jgi:hypothetical protein